MTQTPITRSQALAPFTVACAKCGEAGTAYPYPSPKGGIFCPNCSPAWLESFLKFASKNLQETQTS